MVNYTGYIGGHPGAANSKLSPIQIGVINQQGGNADLAPQWTVGATVGADYINRDAGGIDGHPVKLVTCFIPDQVSNAAQCGQKMANNPQISAISVGAVAIGNQAMESAVAPTGKVMVWGVAGSPIDATYKNGYILFGDGTHVEAPLATFAKQKLHAKRVSIVFENIPGLSVGANIIAGALKSEGVSTNVVGYDPSTTDLAGPIEASKASSADLFIAEAGGGSSCSDMYKGLTQLNITTPVLTNVPCDTPQVATGDGGQLPKGWYYASANPLPGDKSDPSLGAFGKVATQFHQGAYAKDAWVADSFAQMLTIAKWETQVLKSGKQITPANVNRVAKAFKGPVPQGAPDLICGTIKTAPGICNDKVSFFQNTSPGVFKAVARFLGPPPGYHIPAAVQ